MDGPIDDPRYSRKPEPVLQPLPEVNKEPDEIQYEQIKAGRNKGFYRRTPVKDINRPDTVYTKAFFSKRIEGPYDHYLDWFKGFYYIPRNDQIPIRRLVYGLEHNKMPTSGNT